jgi:hypothetical protein
MQTAKQGEHMAAAFATENPVLMLHRDKIDVANVQEVRRTLVRRYVGRCDFKPNSLGVRIAPVWVVHGQNEAFERGELGANCLAQVRREGSYSALARQMIPEHSDSAKAGRLWRWGQHSRNVANLPTHIGLVTL